MRVSSAVIFALAANLVYASDPTPTVKRSLNPAPADLIKHRSISNGDQSLGKRAPAPIAAPAPLPPTNARRLQLGLPLKKPTRRTERRPRSVNSQLPPVTVTGYLACTLLPKDAINVNLGVIASALNGFGEYGTNFVTLASDPGRLRLSFSYSPPPGNGTADVVFINALNGVGAGHQLGAITGFSSGGDDFGTGLDTYAYLGSTAFTPAHAPPSTGSNSFTDTTGIPERIESSIWNYTPFRSEITPQWVNTDGSTPPTYLAYSTPDKLLLLTGDIDALNVSYSGIDAVRCFFFEE